MDRDVSDEEVQSLVHQWRMLISENFYQCSIEIFKGLADMYIYDERFTKNIDKYGEGTAEFMAKAIEIYCAPHGSEKMKYLFSGNGEIFT